MAEMYRLLPESYRDVVHSKRSTIFSVDMLDEMHCGLEKYDGDMGKDCMMIIEPPSLNTRIANQYSFFSIIPMEMEDVEAFLDERTDNTVKYIIDKNLRWRIRDMLDELNVSERIVYPGLGGLSKWIARHYYVKWSQLQIFNKTVAVVAVLIGVHLILKEPAIICKVIFAFCAFWEKACKLTRSAYFFARHHA